MTERLEDSPLVPELNDPAYRLEEERNEEGYFRLTTDTVGSRFNEAEVGTITVEYVLRNGRPWARRETFQGIYDAERDISLRKPDASLAELWRKSQGQPRTWYVLNLYREVFQIEVILGGLEERVDVSCHGVGILPQKTIIDQLYEGRDGRSPTDTWIMDPSGHLSFVDFPFHDPWLKRKIEKGNLVIYELNFGNSGQLIPGSPEQGVFTLPHFWRRRYSQAIQSQDPSVWSNADRVVPISVSLTYPPDETADPGLG